MISATLDNRLRIKLNSLSDSQIAAVQREFTYENPDYKKALARTRGRWTPKNIPRTLSSWDVGNGFLSVPRGGLDRVTKILGPLRIVRAMTEGDPELAGRMPRMIRDLRSYQSELRNMATTETPSGTYLLRSPPGSGKTTTCYAIASTLNLPTLVVVPTSKIFKQWVEGVRENLGMDPSEVGIIQGQTRKIRPLTIGMQQTLRSCASEYAGTFGIVIGEECFEGSAIVLMQDGSTKRISEVNEGDYVAGGRVTGLIRGSYVGKAYTLKGSLVTPGHPLGTTEGWVSVEKVCGSDFLGYHSMHGYPTLQSLQSTSPITCCWPNPPEVQAFELSKWEMLGLWQVCTQTIQGEPYCSEVWGNRPLEQGEERGPNRLEQGADQRDQHKPSESICEDNSGLEKQSHSPALECCYFEGAAQALCQTRRTPKEFTTRQDSNRQWCNDSLWRSRARQWWSTHQVRTSSETTFGETRVLGSAHHSNQEATPLSNSLQVGLWTPCVETSGRVRWVFSQSHQAPDSRQAEDQFPPIDWVEGSEIQGTGGLEVSPYDLRPAGIRAFQTFNLETESGAYVVNGVLVHNCQRFASTSFFEVIDLMRAAYRIGVSASEKRADRKEFLIYDVFGPVMMEVARQDLLDRGNIIDAEIKIVPTEFRAPWYEQLKPQRRMNTNAQDRLASELSEDEERNALIMKVLGKCVEAGEPTITMARRREHCAILNAKSIARGWNSGLLLGGLSDKQEFERTVREIREGALKQAVGTYQAVGVGFDLPSVSRGIFASPCVNQTSKNQFGQFCGRYERPAPGKTKSTIYYIWDKHIYGLHPVKHIASWKPKVYVLHESRWVPAKQFIREEIDRAESKEKADDEALGF